MGYLLAFAGFLLVCYMVADKEQVKRETEKMNRWAKPLCFIIVATVAFLFFGYPYLSG